MTSEKFESKRDTPGTIAYPADKEGRTLYDRGSCKSLINR
jgi:hypothetical protein